MNAKNVFHAALTTLAMGTIGASQVPAQQPSLLNPLTWFNTPTNRTSCATGNCPNQVYRPAAYQQPIYQTNYAPSVYQPAYAPAVADTYYYPTSGTNVLPVGGIASPACPGGVCPSNVPMNCSNGQCYPANCPNGQCLQGSGNFGTNYRPVAAPVYQPNGSFYGPTGSAATPYYTTQVNAPVNYNAQTYPVSQNFVPYNNGQYNNGQFYGGQVNGGYVPPFRTRAVDLPESFGGNLR